MRAAPALLALALAPGALLAAQGGWTPPQPPCDLPPANSKINNAITALRTAGEKPESRDQQLVQAKRLLTDAILQDKQDANPAAWYYHGRLAVITSDVAGADTALARAATLAPKCADDIAKYRHVLWGELLNNGLAAWQDGKQDSGLVSLRLAVRLEALGSRRPTSSCSRATPRRGHKPRRSGAPISPRHWDRSPPTRARWRPRSHRRSTPSRSTSGHIPGA